MSSPNSDQPTEAELRDLAALADGSLPEARRGEVEGRVAASDALSAELARQRAAVAAIGGVRGELGAPPRLRARIEAERERRKESARRRRPILGAVAAGLAAVVLAIAVLPGGGPTVSETTELAARPATGPAPGPLGSEPAVLAADLDGLSFPNWEPEFGWEAAGVRADELDGRDAETVFYEKRGGRLAYTIVSGESLERPADARTTVVDGVEFSSFETAAGEAVTWLRDGHTCVLVGEGVAGKTLVELAAWKGDGAVVF